MPFFNKYVILCLFGKTQITQNSDVTEQNRLQIRNQELKFQLEQIVNRSYFFDSVLFILMFGTLDYIRDHRF